MIKDKTFMKVTNFLDTIERIKELNIGHQPCIYRDSQGYALSTHPVNEEKVAVNFEGLKNIMTIYNKGKYYNDKTLIKEAVVSLLSKLKDLSLPQNSVVNTRK